MFDKNQKYAFISYSHANKEVVEAKLKELQEKYDLNIWWDKNLIAGMHWFDEQVVSVLNDENCCCVIYFGSKEALQSVPCEHELQLANRNEIRIIPVNFDDKMFEDIANELQSAVAASIAEKYLPKDNIFVSIKSGEFGEEIKKAYDHYSGENKKKNSAKWIDVELASDIKKCYEDEDYDPDEDGNPTYIFSPDYMTMILSMFYCEICKFKSKAKFDYYVSGSENAEIVYYGDDGKKEYTMKELLTEIKVLNSEGINYHDEIYVDYEGKCVHNVEAIAYLAKIVNLFADDNEKMNFRNMDNVDIAQQFTERYGIEEFSGTITDYYPGQSKVIRYDPYIDYEDFEYDQDYSVEGTSILHFDELYAILKTFWKKFVDPEAE